MTHPVLPNFFIVGAGKTGTTSLHAYLQQHPAIFMSPVKEPCFFATEIRPGKMSAAFQRHVQRQSLQFGKEPPANWIASTWEEYLRLFEAARAETAIGEASAAYLWSETAARNIHSAIPHARIIMILRDPAERAFSQYLHQVATGLTRDTFARHVRRCVQEKPAGLSICHPFLEVGLYSAQVKRYLDLFPPEQVRICWFEDAWKDPPRFLADLFTFLDVDAQFRPDFSQRLLERRQPRLGIAHYYLKKLRLWQPLRSLIPIGMTGVLRRAAFRSGGAIRMHPNDRRYLTEYYRTDVLKLADLLNRDLTAWLT